MARNRCAIQFVLVALALIGSLGADGPAPVKAPVYLDQGWTPNDRVQFYFTSQGSQLIPYDWFLALERADGNELFRANLKRFGFIEHGKDDQLNPDSLPIGFAKHDDPKTMEYIIKKSFLGDQFQKDDPLVNNNKWLGLTCAACHTTEIEYGDNSYRVDGGPALTDVEQFLRQLSQAVKATFADKQKMTRFAKRVIPEGGYNATEQKALQKQVEAYSAVLERVVNRSVGTSPYGFGRLDAFGAILNEICETSLEIPENHYPADAPASYPFLWDTPQLDWVQWNGSIGNPIARNVGEVLGVFGQFRLLPDPPSEQFRSTAHMVNLFELEQMISKLKSPQWPAAFGAIDQSRAKQGEQLFANNCAVCHGVPDSSTGKYPTRTIGGREFIKTKMIPPQELGTDPKLVINFGKRLAKPGVLAPLLPPALAGQERVPRPVLLSIAVSGILKRYFKEAGLTPDQVGALTGHRPPNEEPPNPGAYKARPLNGIWATAPYLHNGSVPNLYELLLPSSSRSKSFFVGDRKFDPKKVGFITEASQASTEFKVADQNGPIFGNLNAGHEGHGPGEKLGFTQTFENGAWRDFTEDERWALIEYMKTLRSGPSASTPGEPTAELEQVPSEEPSQIASVIESTFKQLKNRYPDQKRMLRGVHAKDHGCVRAMFQVLPDLDPKYRVGVFAEPGRQYQAWIRFSNAATLVLPDDTRDENGKFVPGSRGMAIKLMGVTGEPLVPPHGALTQDFLMVNHPVFAFANVEDYEVLSTVLADPANKERPDEFFKIQFGKGGASAARAKATLSIVSRIRAPDVASGAYQAQPASPVDCRYFSAAPFLFGDKFVMKYGAVPVDPPADPKPNSADPNYLRNALIERLADREGSKAVVFNFQIQLRDVKELDIPNDIENASTEWPESRHSFATVATITIPPQEFDSPAQREFCEKLIMTPWHGIQEHRPLGGINRMRKRVYEASFGFRNLPKEPAAP